MAYQPWQAQCPQAIGVPQMMPLPEATMAIAKLRSAAIAWSTGNIAQGDR
jgi:hypothetical protein